MALSAGSVTVDSEGVRTGSGLALARYDARKARFDAAMAGVSLPLAQIVPMLQQIAASVTAEAAADIDYLTANAVVSIIVDQGGIQTTPTPNNAGVATDAPASPVKLEGGLS